MSGDKLPLTVENVMAEKDKVAEAAIRGENYDPFGIAESFGHAAAADAINAVVQNAPSVSAPAGLEMQPEVELVDKDVVMENTEAPQRSKSPEPDWELADPVPVTELELVGDLLKDQEEEDRAQFVFLSEWKEEDKEQTLKAVTSQLDDLTNHIQELSVGGGPTGTMSDQHGPQMDEPKLLAVEPAGDGLFKLTCFPDPTFLMFLAQLPIYSLASQSWRWPSSSTYSKARPSPGQGLKGPWNVTWSPSEARITRICSRGPTPASRPSTVLATRTWSTRRLVILCSGCAPNASLLVTGPNPLACSASPRRPLSTARSLRPTCWRMGSNGHFVLTTKETIIGRHGHLSRRKRGSFHWPGPCLNPQETSFADQVPQSIRISLRQQVVTEDPDPYLVEAPANTKEEEDPREGSKVFHPAAAKALKIKQAVMLDPIEPPKVDEAKIDEMVDLTTEVLGEMQSGALSVADKEALGAQVLRQLDMSHFRDCLKRSYLDGPGRSSSWSRSPSVGGRTKPGRHSRAMSLPRSRTPKMRVAWRCNTSQYTGTVRFPQPRLVPSTTSWATVQQRSLPWAWTPIVGLSHWRPKERRSWGKEELTALNLPLGRVPEASIPRSPTAPLRRMMARPTRKQGSHPSRCTMQFPPWGRTTCGRTTLGVAVMHFGVKWSVALCWAVWAPARWSRKRRGHTWWLSVQMVPRILERQDGQFQVPPDYIGQDGSAACPWWAPRAPLQPLGGGQDWVLQAVGAYCTTQGCSFEGGPKPGAPPSLQCVQWHGQHQWRNLDRGACQPREGRPWGHPPLCGQAPPRMTASPFWSYHFEFPSAPLHDCLFCSGSTLDVSLQPPVCGNPRAGVEIFRGSTPLRFLRKRQLRIWVPHMFMRVLWVGFFLCKLSCHVLVHFHFDVIWLFVFLGGDWWKPLSLFDLFPSDVARSHLTCFACLFWGWLNCYFQVMVWWTLRLLLDFLATCSRITSADCLPGGGTVSTVWSKFFLAQDHAGLRPVGTLSIWEIISQTTTMVPRSLEGPWIRATSIRCSCADALMPQIGYWGRCLSDWRSAHPGGGGW